MSACSGHLLPFSPKPHTENTSVENNWCKKRLILVKLNQLPFQDIWGLTDSHTHTRAHTCGLLQPSIFRCDWEYLTLALCSAADLTRKLNIANYFCSWVESSSWLRLLSFLATSFLRMYLDYSEVSRLLGPLLKKGFCFLPVQSATDALGSTFDKQESNLKNFFEVCSLVHSKQRKKEAISIWNWNWVSLYKRLTL